LSPLPSIIALSTSFITCSKAISSSYPSSRLQWWVESQRRNSKCEKSSRSQKRDDSAWIRTMQQSWRSIR
jgi:hypothetical protein